MNHTDTAQSPWRRRTRRVVTLWPTMVVGAVLWVLLWGDLSWANVLSGVLLGALVALAFPLPPVGTATTLRVGPLLHLLGRFVGDLVLASFQVAWTAVVPRRTARGGPTPHGALVSVPLRSDSDLFIATTAGLSSLVPGTLVIDLDRPSRTLRLHVLDIAASGGPEGVRDATLDLEARLLRAFAPSTELARVGLAPYTLHKEERR
ncbi:Na+/H+ antiporter subunit E [Promicromonospora sp. MEB111]|uniref:Na+/H+ antiporter subunit E n=1 Tax=Promicromonospora sp. MEB111 TaxID=3040301 RepID=UPI00254DB92D|nr:Na+/H+ antiporter subunit E [Promicromonospora sp. MEB111]